MTCSYRPVLKARLILSRRVISSWEAMGLPGGDPEDNLRMIDQELLLLAEAATPEADELAGRYRQMAQHIRRRDH
jgi:hypothetical protein